LPGPRGPGSSWDRDFTAGYANYSGRVRYDLVIFDNDGVLVDSEPISHRILADHLTELGLQPS
jgi:hypothetical protein